MRTPDSTLIETKAKYTSVIYATLKGQGWIYTFMSYLSESPLSTSKSCNSWATTSMPDRRYNNAKAFYLSTLLALLLLFWNCTSNAKSWNKNYSEPFLSFYKTISSDGSNSFCPLAWIKGIRFGWGFIPENVISTIMEKYLFIRGRWSQPYSWFPVWGSPSYLSWGEAWAFFSDVQKKQFWSSKCSIEHVLGSIEKRIINFSGYVARV